METATPLCRPPTPEAWTGRWTVVSKRKFDLRMMHHRRNPPQYEISKQLTPKDLRPGVTIAIRDNALFATVLGVDCGGNAAWFALGVAIAADLPL
jgi:hypothetical protein